MTSKTALIVGASRGLGLGLVREYLKRDWHVIGTARGTGTGLHELAKTAGDRLQVEQLDINDTAELAALRGRLAGRSLDLLFVNAGVAENPNETIAEVPTDSFVRVMTTNALAPMRVIEALQSLVPAGGTIGAMSSGLGSVADNESGGWEVYRASKAALNTLMRSFAARHQRGGRSLLLISPGWVRTDMGGPSASLDIETSIPKVVDVIDAQTGKPGLRFLNYTGETMRW